MFKHGDIVRFNKDKFNKNLLFTQETELEMSLLGYSRSFDTWRKMIDLEFNVIGKHTMVKMDDALTVWEPTQGYRTVFLNWMVASEKSRTHNHPYTNIFV